MRQILHPIMNFELFCSSFWYSSQATGPS